MGQEVIGSVPGNVLGMLADLCLKLKAGSLEEEQLALFLQGKNPFVGNDQLVADWARFYAKFGLEVDFSGLVIPEKKAGLDRLIIVAQGLTPNQVYGWCQSRFPCWRYVDDLDAAVQGRNDREPTKAYAIWVRDRVEADDELKGLSAKTLEERGIITETLLERLLHELKYHDETGQHLDITNITLCAGSRSSDGDVPSVGWYGSGLEVRYYGSGYAYGSLRARSVVS